MMWEEKVFYLRRDAREEGRQEGLQEGRQEGMQEGTQNERERQVRAKLTKGKESEQIADELELTLNEVDQIISSIESEK